MRRKKTLQNFIALFVLQIVSIVVGLIIPRLIIINYGSNVNGTIVSATKFLSYITLFEAGVGGVFKAALYKPLANKDNSLLSKILHEADSFFKRISYIFIIYLVGLSLSFSYISRNGLGYFYNVSLVLILGINILMQYYFGLKYDLLLQADQKRYVSTIIQIISVLINLLLVLLLIKLNFTIHIVYLISSIVFALKPLILYKYVFKNYQLIKIHRTTVNYVQYKLDGLAHHVAYVIHTNTDIVLITLFLTAKDVSIYSIYSLILTGLNRIVNIISQSISGAIGNILAKDERKTLDKVFNSYIFANNIIVTSLYIIASIMILPFIKIYTSGINDADYIMPYLAYILIFAESAYCIRLPFNTLVTAAGHYKETRNGAFMEALINIIVSLVLIKHYGVYGLAIGTLMGMLYRTVYFIYYVKANLLKSMRVIKNLILNVILAIIIYTLHNLNFELNVINFLDWVIYSTVISTIVFIIVISTNVFFFKKDFYNFISIIKK